ncbi:MAG: peptide MFS transporter [Verrucomicrobia bacterium]|nr:peptide MFS transporter [Verrucomicrobiota bacterium]
MSSSSPSPATGWRGLFEHPRGLWVLAGTELWDRISFHGMQALLVLYMTGTLLQPGHVEHILGFAQFRAAIEALTGPLTVTALAAQTFGLYVGLIYFTPIIGGTIGDRLTGRRAAIVAGGALMTLGHFALAFDATFLVALVLLIVGAGLLRGNMSAQLKSLYADGDRREADAFQLYYVAINLGAFIAPILTGALAQKFGWHTGFGFAGVGMLVGLVVYLAGLRHLPPDRPAAALAPAERVPLTAQEKRRLFALALVWPISVCFWIAQSQVWNVYNLWVRDHLDLQVGSFTVPVAWLQAMDGLAPVLVLPIFLALWRKQAARGSEPDSMAKMMLGCFIFAAGTAWLAAAPWVSGADGRAPIPWALAFHLITNVGWLYFTPICLALYASLSPPAMRGTLIGLNALSVFAAGLISGRLGALYETTSQTTFWLIHAGVVAAGGVGLLFLGRWLRGLLDEPAR